MFVLAETFSLKMNFYEKCLSRKNTIANQLSFVQFLTRKQKYMGLWEYVDGVKLDGKIDGEERIRR